MKKTLVALAVLAASGASFAQVTLTGDLEYGYAQSHKGSNGGDAGGWGVDTSELYFDAVEDLGGGLKVSAHMGLIGADRSHEGAGSNKAVTGEDAKLTVSGGFGSVMFGAVRNGDYMNGVTGVAAAPGFDGKVDDARSYRDVIIYNTPALIPGLTGQIYLSEPNYQSNAAADTGLGAGSLGSTGQRKDILSLNYGAGAVKANIGYISADNRDSANAASTKLANGYRLGGTYDAGVVLVGAGYERDSLDNGTDTTTALNLNVPLGAFSVGANWVSRQFSGKPGQADGTKTGYGLGARYALSKSTAVWAQMWSFDDVVNTSDRSTGFEMAIAKSF